MSNLGPKDILLYLISKSGEDPDKLKGRKKLMKLAFFAEHYSPLEGDMSDEPLLGNYEFFIFKYGPFSKDVMDAFDELKENGLVDEDDDFMKHIIRVTDTRQDSIEEIESRLSKEVGLHLNLICDEFGDYTGAQLENMSLERLGIDKQEKQQYRGMPIPLVLSRKAE